MTRDLEQAVTFRSPDGLLLAGSLLMPAGIPLGVAVQVRREPLIRAMPRTLGSGATTPSGSTAPLCPSTAPKAAQCPRLLTGGSSRRACGSSMSGGGGPLCL